MPLMNSDAEKAELAANRLADRGSSVDDVIAKRITAATFYARDGKWLEEANNLSLAGQACLYNVTERLSTGMLSSEKAVELLSKAVAVHERLGHADHAYRENELLYRALCNAALYYQAKHDQAKISKFADAMRFT